MKDRIKNASKVICSLPKSHKRTIEYIEISKKETLQDTFKYVYDARKCNDIRGDQNRYLTPHCLT